ncbi:hypothetical protein CEXT_546101 [Caerostris extrusa]|uniref:Uncharacterized protein n=1 Tax=Caerostris extrusa TaxID=172846 RepID=A0AAV4QC75_CAEEX|nr:hypothetical protein CEXT_546101 [Caerostris extrusa]
MKCFRSLREEQQNAPATPPRRVESFGAPHEQRCQRNAIGKEVGLFNAYCFRAERSNVEIELLVEIEADRKTANVF